MEQGRASKRVSPAPGGAERSGGPERAREKDLCSFLSFSSNRAVLGESLYLSVPQFLYLEKGGDGSPGRLSEGACTWAPAGSLG